MTSRFTVDEELQIWRLCEDPAFFNVRSSESDVTEATGVVQFLVVFLSNSCSFGTPVVSKMG